MGTAGGGRPRERERAVRPEDLARLLVERLNAGDVEGLVALYEPEATLVLPPGRVRTGAAAIREAYRELLDGLPEPSAPPGSPPSFVSGEQRPALRRGELALTSTRLPGGGVTAEVARRQADGTWLWVIDQPDVLG